jgi:hypothetical protein
MSTYPFEKNGPPLFPITSEDWWVKVLGMLQHNWALIETHKDSVTVYFFHDEGITRGFLKGYTLKQLRNRCAIIDSLEFKYIDEAKIALTRNSFDRLRENPGSWDGLQPHGNFYDARSGEEGIYSKSGYWED